MCAYYMCNRYKNIEEAGKINNFPAFLVCASVKNVNKN